jgi:transcription antitermination protein NusB
MITRRHIRIKVMQTIFAMQQKNSDDIVKEEKFLLNSIEIMQDLYLVLLSTLIEIQKNETVLIQKRSVKHLATAEEKNPNKKFINNLILNFLVENKSIKKALEERKIINWTQNNDIILMLIDEIKNSVFYKKYMHNDVNEFDEDLRFIDAIYGDVIAPNEKLYDYLEESKLTWVDDIPLINTLIIKQLNEIDFKKEKTFFMPSVYRDEDDKEFVSNLFRKTVLNQNDFLQYYETKTPSWDVTRFAKLDAIILNMAICEMLKFPSIPTKVTINEYVEIAKEYCTPNSSIFLNGVMDVISKELAEKNLLNKIGRGLV